MQNTQKERMAGKSATVNNRDDLIRTRETTRVQAAFPTGNGLPNLFTKTITTKVKNV